MVSSADFYRNLSVTGHGGRDASVLDDRPVQFTEPPMTGTVNVDGQGYHYLARRVHRDATGTTLTECTAFLKGQSGLEGTGRSRSPSTAS